MDFSQFPDSGKFYAGSERKKGIIIGNDLYMVKFQKESPFGKEFNHVSEHLGSEIFKLAGMRAQDTLLGTFGESHVVVCRDFNSENTQFVPFNDVGESTLEEDKDTYQYEYEDIMRMLRDNSKLTNVDETIMTFWRMYVIDALIGNFDRHGANWGFLKTDNKYTMAPIFDNGSCLFPRQRDDGSIQELLSDSDEMHKRVYTFPTSQIKLHGKKSSYYEVVSSGEYEECNQALEYVMEHLDMAEVFQLVDGLPEISETRREFYKKIIELRYRLILEQPYQNIK